MSEQAGAETNETNVNQDQVQSKEVDMAAYESLKNDMYKYKRQAAEAAKERESWEQEKKTWEAQRLEEKSNYKELAERYKQELESEKEKTSKFAQARIEEKKMTEILKYAKDAGIRKEWVDDLENFDMSDVIVESVGDGKFSVSGADLWIKSLKESKPSMFNDGKEDPNINNGSGGFDGREKTYTTKELLELQKSDYNKYVDVIKNKKHLIVR